MIFKKVSALLAAMIIVAGGMTSCGKEQNDDISAQETESTANEGQNEVLAEPFDYENADLTQYVILCDYKGLNVEKQIVPVTDADIDAEIEKIREEYTHYEPITDRTVAEGDTVIADYAGYKDGVAFGGGTASDQEITASPNTGYIEGFAEAFVGQMPGEEFSFDVTFPEDYQNSDLAGAEVTFVCTVKYINGENLIVPEINEEFVMENFQCSTVEDFRTMISESLAKKNDYNATNFMHNNLFKMIIDNSTYIAYPEEEVNRLYENYSSMYKTYADYYAMEYEAFLEYYMGTTSEGLYESMRQYVKEDLITHALIKEFNAELTAIEYTERVAYIAGVFGMDSSEFEDYYGRETIEATLLWEEIMDSVAATANITEVMVDKTAETEVTE